MTVRILALIVCFFLLAVCPVYAGADPVLLVDKQSPRAVLVMPAEPAAAELDAADELAATIQQISGAMLTRVTAGDNVAGLLPVYIGSAAPAEVSAAIKQQSSSDAALALWVEPGRIVVTGATPEATYFAACELLEQLGVRWFMPGKLGTVIPTMPTVSLASQRTIQSPSFKARHIRVRDEAKWLRRIRVGGPLFPAAHGLPGLKNKPAVIFKEHPEYFALVKGKRVQKQHCVSNPDVIQVVIKECREAFRKNPDSPWIGIGPNDGAGFCECDKCTALDAGDYDPFSAERSVTDRYIWFFNQVLAGLDGEFKDKKIAFYSYHTYMRPPLRVKPDPRIVPAIAPIALCRIHGPDNPVCPEKSYYKWLVQSWGKLLPEVYDRGYWFNLADPGFVFSMVHVVRKQIPLGYELGIKGWKVECFGRFAAENPSLYIAGKLLWNHKADVDALMSDFAEKYYGPAARPMLTYHRLVDETLRDSDHHTGSAHDTGLHFTKAMRDQARTLLEEAEKLAGGKDGQYQQRVEVTRLAFDQLESFIAMLENRNKLDFPAAMAALKRIDALTEALVAIDPVLVDHETYVTYMKRFFRLPIEQGFERVTAGNVLVAQCDDKWSFQMDPKKVGEALGYHRPEHIGGNWQPINASTSWSNQGLRYYSGVAWYRQTVVLADSPLGKRVFLWAGGADEKARVWLNGHDLGTINSKFYPFELDATHAIVAGKNVIVIAVLNEKVDELGTGGLTGPVMLYAPAAGAQATLKNTRPTADTFP